MTNEVEIYLDLPPEAVLALSEGRIDLPVLLAKDAIEVRQHYDALPEAGAAQPYRSKDIVPVLVAASAGLSMTILALARLLDTIYHRPRVFEIEELARSEDDGWHVTHTHVIAEPNPASGTVGFEFRAGIRGVVLRMRSKTG